MKNAGKYIYGVLSSDKELFFDPHEVAACEKIYTIAYQDISAVVSDSEIVDYTHMRKDALAMLLVRHQKAIEMIMGLRHTIIPMRLGTFAKDAGEVEHILECGYSIIKDIFSKIADMIEIDVTATLSNFTSVLKEIGEGEDIKEFKERLMAAPGGVTVDDQMKVGLMVKDELDKVRNGYSRAIQDALKGVSEAFKTHELMDDKMAANIAFLINRVKRGDFETKVEELNIGFNEDLNFRCVGPLPPYSFYTLEIKALKYEEIDWAKKRLGVPSDITSRHELKKAYQRRAFSTHPDKNPKVSGAEKEFNEVNKAYKILDDYCTACEQASQKENAVLMVRIRE